MIETGLELAGLLLLVVAAFLVSPVLGVAAAGAVLLLAGVMLDRGN